MARWVKKRSLAQQEQLCRARGTMGTGETLKEGRTGWQNELEVTKVLLAGRTVEVKEKDLALSETEATFHNTRDELHVTREELRSVGITLHDTEDLLSAAKTKSTTWYSLLRLERRKVVRLRGHQPRLRDAVAAAYNLDTTSRDQRCRRKSPSLPSILAWTMTQIQNFTSHLILYQIMVMFIVYSLNWSSTTFYYL
ncbi:hypothetical protein PAXINDRAFT_182203 [Paxillus involutus ATCC 200175]|uniref:Uncharacterized protein n=1 Tax=Paxillus involutus ATCC 200175 TaxID=664439 RepID=A0A0C9TM84_PAXIN|nr:hypothetical protein PAXINDRAFT_182203 [Paxillus involutus ATCC 200175]